MGLFNDMFYRLKSAPTYKVRKRLLTSVLVAVSVIGLAGCGKETGEPTNNEPTEKVQNTIEATVTIESNETIEPVVTETPTPTAEPAKEMLTINTEVPKRAPLSESGAIIIAKECLGLKANEYEIAGAKLLVEVTKNLTMTNQSGEEENCYEIRFSTDEDDHIAIYSTLVVGSITGSVWQYDVVMDEYNLISDAYEIKSLTADDKDYVLGSVLDCVNDLHRWMYNPVDEVDTVKLLTGKNYDEYEFETAQLILVANNDDTVVTINYGKATESEFVLESTVASFKLNKEQYIYLDVYMPETIPTMEIVLENGTHKASYYPQMSGLGESITVKVEYE